MGWTPAYLQRHMAIDSSPNDVTKPTGQQHALCGHIKQAQPHSQVHDSSKPSDSVD